MHKKSHSNFHFKFTICVEDHTNKKLPVPSVANHIALISKWTKLSGPKIQDWQSGNTSSTKLAIPHKAKHMGKFQFFFFFQNTQTFIDQSNSNTPHKSKSHLTYPFDFLSLFSKNHTKNIKFEKKMTSSWNFVNNAKFLKDLLGFTLINS